MSSCIITQNHYAKIIDQQTGEVVQAGSLDALCALLFGVGAASAAGGPAFCAGGPADEQAPTRREAPVLSSVPYQAARGGASLARRLRVRRWADGLEVELLSGEGRPEFVQVCEDDDQDQDQGEDQGEGVGSSRRGEVVGFSKRSRSRMMREMAKTLIDARALFCTLTLSDDVVTDWLGADGLPDLVALSAHLKESQKALVKRAWRKFGRDKVALIWRLELVPRKSGRYQGALVPHLHWLLVVHPGSARRFRQWLWGAWASVNGTSCRVDVQTVYSRRHAAYYVSKYLGKCEDGEGVQKVGRRWGELGALPQPVDDVGEVEDVEWIPMRRALVRWLHAKGGRADRYGRRVARQRVAAGCFIYGAGIVSEGVGDLARALFRAAGLSPAG